MATNLYEVLGLNRHASQEENRSVSSSLHITQVRKAYRRKALETHPDRLPQNASAADKAASEEMFRKVNNAYEVLNDPANRKIYDEHGVWPPQAPQANGRPNEWEPFSGPSFRSPFFSDPFFSDPFFTRGRSDPFSGFGFGHTPFRGFTDPFVLFNSIFGDLHRAFSEDSFFNDPLDRPFTGGFGSPFSLLAGSPFSAPRGNVQSISSSSRGMLSGGNGRWTSESWTTQTINGVTQTKCVRKDSEGNEHILYKLPDGTVRRTVNGIEQPSGDDRRAIQSPPARDGTFSQPPPPYEVAVNAPPPVQPRGSHTTRDPRSSSYHGRHDTSYRGDENLHSHRHGSRYGHGDRLGRADGHGHTDRYSHTDIHGHADKHSHRHNERDRHGDGRYDHQSRHGGHNPYGGTSASFLGGGK
ncbi:hypothetical protein EDD15DRAFT_2195613 [Pisolithus albus]|nr:hypothetical protein EDD15DRAFT_2195613 [Pisolithus albus]